MNFKGAIYNRDLGVQESCEIRNMEVSEIDEILKLQEKILYRDSFDLEWFFPFSKEELEEILEQKNAIALGVFVNGKLVAFRTGGSCGAEYNEITRTLGSHFTEVPCFLMNGAFVENAYRGNGLQTMMTEYCMEECLKKGIKTFVALVHPDNKPSIASLKKAGLTERTRQMVFDGKYDRLILVKEEH
jgi:RimJ/RimL family protein N-acetyltransferase